jgi:hypothetical protein
MNGHAARRRIDAILDSPGFSRIKPIRKYWLAKEYLSASDAVQGRKNRLASKASAVMVKGIVNLLMS